MAKTVFKEIVIILLLCLAIILLLGVLLYGYIPSNKVIPEKIAYVAPDEIKQELNASVQEQATIESNPLGVDSTELNNAQKINVYNPGKANPFAAYEAPTESTSDTTTNTDGTSASTNSSSTSNNSNTNSNSAYSIDRGTK